MTVAIHQPNFLPWIGYFYKIWASDTFVLHDKVQYTKHSYTKRVLIRESLYTQRRVLLSVSLKRHSDFSLIQDLEICYETQWQKHILNKIKNAYQRTPYFDAFFPIIAAEVKQNHQYLSDLNIALIKRINEIIDIKTPLILSSQLDLPILKADEYNAAIARKLGASTYLSGTGAKKYQSEATYTHQNIALAYNNFGHYFDTQVSQEQLPVYTDTSILDTLFFLGSEKTMQLFEASRQEVVLV